MALQSFEYPDAATLDVMGFDRLRKQLGPEPILDSTKYAIALIRLGPGVAPANYAALKTAIEALAGIDEITLLVDHQDPRVSPAGYHQVLRGRAEIVAIPNG